MAAIGLGDVIRALRAELESAIQEGEGRAVRFDASSVDLEFQVGVTRTGEGKVGIRFWVVELGGTASYAAESIQTVRLSLVPVLAGGRKVRIARQSEQNPLASKSSDDDER